MSPPLPSVSSRQLLAALTRMGFEIHHQTGSHIHLRSRENPSLRVVVPAGRRDLKKKTLQSILKQAGIDVAEFLSFL